MKLLVHACCGPCSIMPTRLLQGQGHHITIFYANSNIAPKAEYDKRLAELRKYASAQGFALVEGAYDPEAWEEDAGRIGESLKGRSPALSGVGGHGPAARLQSESALQSEHGQQFASEPQSVAELLDDENRRERCRACYRMRLKESAQKAARDGFEGLATTLAVSPYQFTDVIREELERACGEEGIEPLFEDYRPYYDEATRISRELGMYRQNYCGCRFSVKEGQATRAFIKRQRAEQKAARAAAQAQQRAEEQKMRDRRATEKRIYAEKQAKKRAILRAMRNAHK